MSLPLLQTKLYIPTTRQKLVARPAITAKVRAGVLQPVTLIAAPAGFGKTTLVSEWIAQKTQAVAWLSLDDDDNEPARFLTYMIAALQTQQPQIGVVAQGLLAAPQAPPPKAILTLLLNDLSTLTSPLVLVLDDYHLITAPVLHEALTFFIDHLPRLFHLVILTRIDPPWPLARWRVRNQLTEVRAADLRFTLPETATFFNDVMGLTLSAHTIATLEARTEGWIAGLQLAALSLQGRDDISGFIQAFRGSHTYIVDYLVEEVLQRQSSSVQDFLLQTAILDRLTGALCNAVTLRDDSQALLEALHQGNVFITPLDNERRWYRYHHLFVDVLRSRLQGTMSTGASTVAELHRRASVWYEGQGLLGEAIGHALDAGAFEEVVRLLEQMGMMVFAQGALHSMLTKWLAALPVELVRSRPKLCLMRAWLLFNRMDPQAALERLVEAEGALLVGNGENSNLADEHNTRGEIAATRAITTIYSRRFDSEQIKAWAQEALAYLHPDNGSYRGLVFGALGTAAMQQGDVVRAEEYFTQAVAVSRSQRTATEYAHMLLAAVFHLTNLQRARGRLRLALATCRQTLDWATLHGAQTTFGAGMLLIQLADLLCERNELTTALQHATAGVALSHQGVHPSLFLVGSLVLVRIKEALGQWEGIDDLLRQMRQMAMPLYQADWIVALLPAIEAHVHLRQGDLAAAWQWAQQTDWAESLSDYFRGTHHFVYAYEYGGLTRAQVLLHYALSRPSSGADAAARQALLLEAMTYLAQQGQLAAANGLQRRRIKLFALQALACQTMGDAVQAQSLLTQALTLAEPEGYIRLFVEEGEPMRLLILDFRFCHPEGTRQQTPNEQQRRLLTYIDTVITAFGALLPEQDRPTSTAPPPIQNQKSKIQNLVEPLTPRELEVLQLIAAGHSNREIARVLVVSLGTVKKHLSNIFGKLATESRTQTVARARELDLL